ncbi:hypothetical protein [Suilimivivens sp.]|uniref:hypothetical protein n=1 Tax=Suilimivivens sp. TaxID=2981669 RepID=UPI00307A9A39
MAEKEFMLADFPMTKNKEELKAAWEKTAEEICRLAEQRGTSACKESTEKRGNMPGEKRRRATGVCGGRLWP